LRVQKTDIQAQEEQPPKKHPLTVSRSEVVKMRPLEQQCQVKPEADTTVSRSALLEEKVLLAVKNVLSRAVLENGKIDERNLGTILQAMRSQMFLENDFDESRLGQSEEKPSMTSVNNTTLRENQFAKKPKNWVGLRRQDIPDKKSGYQRIYTNEPSGTDLNEGTTVYDNNVKLNGDTSMKDVGRETKPQADDSKLDIVGDHLKEKVEPVPFWKSCEDEKLQNHIATLVKNMKVIKDQLNRNEVLQEFNAEMEKTKDDCRSFCVCKVCLSTEDLQRRKHLQVSKKDTQVDLNKCTLNCDVKEKKQPLSGVKSTARSSLKLSPAIAKSRESRLNVRKAVNTEPKVKVLKRNDNFQPESKMTFVPQLAADSLVSAPGFNASEEQGDDMYLQRKIKRSTSKKM